MSLPTRCIVVVFASVVASATCGCDGAHPPAQPVTGRLLVDGKPVARAMVALHATGVAGESNVRRPVGRTDSEGIFRLMTYQTGDGAPAGLYAVTVIWPDSDHEHDECEDDGPDDKFHGLFADPLNPPLRITIRPGFNELTLKLSTRGDPPDS